MEANVTTLAASIQQGRAGRFDVGLSFAWPGVIGLERWGRSGMAHREFVDSQGRAWEVWSVRPEYAERRHQTPREDVPAVERRERAEFRVPLGGQWAEGWLCFESDAEKRRLAPVPNDWAEMSTEELERLCESATPTRLPPRRLIE